ncbi:ABC transporter permease [Actinophytocola sp. NPDC049390]|uniref:ABC transporter permease n=1 Tax=Actinophytocola sp. NPDC049390 TaxID=3363894 RepID=UPI0037A89FDC
MTATVSGTRPAVRPRWAGLLARPALIVLGLLVLWWWAANQPLDSIEARNVNGDVIGFQVLEHVELTVICTALTIAIAIPLGIAVTLSRSRTGRLAVLGLGNLGQAIPSVGLIVLLALVISIGVGTAVIALVAYAVLPVLRNTMVGIEGVDPVLTEAARGMGLSRFAVLLTVELPLAVPVILAGVRTALVLTVASAPLAALIDGGGLGGGLFTGLSLNRPVISVTFGVLVAALALLADWLGLLAETLLRPKGI